MAALIEFVCTAAHERRSDPSITVEQRAWAYCPSGGGSNHEWTRIDPTAIETLRLHAGTGRAHLVSDERDEHSLTGRPAR